ncbi:MAG: porin family protein [Gemmatimonadota bacterium]
MNRLPVRTLLVASLAALASSAPALEAQTILGVRGGVSVSSASFDVSETLDDSNRTGFVGGVFLDWGQSTLFGFQVAAQYAQKGAEIDNVDLDLAYLEIPAVVKVGLPLGIVKPSVFGGVALGFNTSCDDPDQVFGADFCDDVSSTEWAGVFGADAAFYLGSLSLWIDARYNVGLNDISSDLEFVDDLKNRAWNISGGVGFGLGG